MPDSPERIVCLTAESADTLFRIGAGDRVVGVSGYTSLPDGWPKLPIVSAYTTIRYDVIEELKPDLVIGFSDLQADAARELCLRGFNVLITNQRTLAETLNVIVQLGRLVGLPEAAQELATQYRQELHSAIEQSNALPYRPKVYFEEWNDPMIFGIGWVSELIRAAGGQDIFSEHPKSATDRVTDSAAIASLGPDVILASWCGKPVDLDAIYRRPGWVEIPAIQHRRVYEIASEHCLQPGPNLFTEGLPRIQELIARAMECA